MIDSTQYVDETVAVDPGAPSRAAVGRRPGVTRRGPIGGTAGPLVLALGLALFGSARVHAQDRHPLEPLDTSSPRATLSGYLDVLEETAVLFKRYKETGYRGAEQDSSRIFGKAARCFDLSEIPPTSRIEITADSHIFLWDILWRIDLPPLDEVPDAEQMEARVAGGGPARWAIPHTAITLARVDEGPRQGEYLFSPETIARLDEFYRKARVLPYRRAMPVADAPEAFKVWGGYLIPPPVTDRMPKVLKAELAGQAVWKWIAITLVLGLLFMLIWLVRRWARTTSDRVPLIGLLRRLAGPIAILLLTPVVAYLMRRQINITGEAIPIVQFLVPSIGYLAWAWLAWLVSLMVAEAVIASPRIREGSFDAHLLRLLARVFGVAAVVLILFYGGTQLGLPLYGLVAGVGVGGLAIALAAQNTLENFLGSINLFTDRPIRVGEFCLYGDHIGTVEEIGVRSTKIRGIDRTVTTVPNADFARMKITNFTRRDRMLVKTTLGLRYETTPDQLRYCLAKLRALLLAHPRVSDDPARVRLVGFGSCSLNLEVFAYVLTSDYNEFLAIQEDLFLRFIDIVKDAGTGFAFPSQTLYMARDAGLDDACQERAELKVQDWRRGNELPFPDFAPDFLQQSHNSLDYPPIGSAVRTSVTNGRRPGIDNAARMPTGPDPESEADER